MTTIYHNPRCSKSRQTLTLLEERGITPEIVEYLKTPPSPAQLDKILEWLDLEPYQLARKKELRELGIELHSLDRNEAIAILVEHPQLIERPIVVTSDGAAIGRPPENVLGLFK